MGADIGGSDAPKSEPNVVPLCDILLVLLIIFMVITPLLKKGANLTLPEASNVVDEPESETMVTIEIKRDGSIILDNKAFKDTDLDKIVQLIEDRLEEKKEAGENKVLLRADAEVPYGTVTEIMEKIRQAQVEFVGLITDKTTK